MQTTSQPAATSAATRASRSGPTPTAAPTISRPLESLAASGCSSACSMSLMVMRPFRRPASSTTISFSMRCLWRSSIDCCAVTLSGTVTSFFVITSATRCSRLRSKRRSRRVRMPTGRFSPSTTGRPEMWWARMRSRASRTRRSGAMVTGSTTMPDSAFLTLLTSSACASTLTFLCTMPMPPSRAMRMAVSASVTVSIAALHSGMLSLMPVVSRVATSTSVGRTALSAGTRRTSSKVRASRSGSSPSMRGAYGRGPTATSARQIGTGGQMVWPLRSDRVGVVAPPAG